MGAVRFDRLALVVRKAGDARATEQRQAEKRGRLAFDDAEVVRGVGVEQAAVRELQHLGFDHLLDGRERAIEDLCTGGPSNPPQRLDEQPVSGEDGSGVAMEDTGCRRATPPVTHIDHIVV